MCTKYELSKQASPSICCTRNAQYGIDGMQNECEKQKGTVHLVALYTWVLLPPAVTLFVAGSNSAASRLDRSMVRPSGASRRLLCIAHSHSCIFIAGRPGPSDQGGSCIERSSLRQSWWQGLECGLRVAAAMLTTELPPPLTARVMFSDCAKSTAAETSAEFASPDPLSSGIAQHQSCYCKHV